MKKLDNYNPKKRLLIKLLKVMKLTSVFTLLCVLTIHANSYPQHQQKLSFSVKETTADQQLITVTGHVSDNAGASMAGVGVALKGTTRGVVTNAEGNYSIADVPADGTLIFSFVGYATKEVNIEGKTVINVTLIEKVTGLNEVVVIGYGTATKNDLTGSVSNITSKHFNKTLLTLSPEQLIQGKVPGMQLTNNSGAPGAETTIRIRGTGSIRSGNQPLFVVDGIPLDGRNTQPAANAGRLGDTPGSNPLNFINTNDIESITVLKDASATAIYGSRGANGVIIITTKKGTLGVPQIDFSASAGISKMFHATEKMNGDQYREALSHRDLNKFDGGASTDALREITRTAVLQNYNLAISGGNAKGNYRVSLGYADQQGIIKKSAFKKYVGSFVGGYSFLKNDRLHVDVNLIASDIINKGVGISNNANADGSLIGNAIEWNPTVPLRDSKGDFVQQVYQHGTDAISVGTNPLALIEYYDDKSDITTILGNISPRFRIIDGLEYRMTVGVNQAKGNRSTDISGALYLGDITGVGLANVGNTVFTTTTINHVLNYKKKLTDVLGIDAIVGYEYLNYKSSVQNIAANGFTIFDIPGSHILQNPANGSTHLTSYVDPTNSLQSFFTRANFNIASKYLLTATFRADGSTKFGKNNKYGYFPSLAGAWVLSEEQFIPELFSDLKLRISYGKTGNQEFPAGAAQSRYSLGQQSLSLSNVANPNLKWETTETYNYALDFGLLNNRISGTVEYFNKTTKNLLFQRFTVQPAPSANYWVNLPAEINNTGVEMSLQGSIVDQKKLLWRVAANATLMKNKLTHYDGATILTGNINGSGLDVGVAVQQIANNWPLYSYSVYRFLGLDDYGVALYSDTKELIGNPSPKMLLGISSDLTIDRFNVNLSFNGAFGYKIYNNTRMVHLSPTNLAIGRNSTSEIGLGNEDLSNSNVVSTRFLEEGNFVRLGNAGLSYNVGSYGGFKNVVLSMTGQNLLLFTKYKGSDPVVNTNKSVNGVPSSGIDYASYPVARTIMIGINLSF